MLGRRLNCRATRIGNVWFLGAIAPEDRGVLVRSVRRLKAEELTKVCTLFASEVGRQVAFEDGLVVVADRVEVLQRLVQALDQLEATPAGCWVVRFTWFRWVTRSSTSWGSMRRTPFSCRLRSPMVRLVPLRPARSTRFCRRPTTRLIPG